MALFDGLKNQFRSIVQWEEPEEFEIFRQFTDRGDELKNASRLILQPGQGCIFTYEGKIQAVFEEEGLYDLKTSNKPFITTFKNLMNAFESEHKAGLWFYRKADIVNIRWGTRLPITYTDPRYGFPVNLCGYGNFSIKIVQPAAFFSNIVAAKAHYYAYELQELFLANAQFSYAEINSNIELIAKEVGEKTFTIFENLGFHLLDFRIEGTSFTEETNLRIASISDVQADVKAAQVAGIDFAELQKLRALRDAAKNEGAAGAGVGLFTGVNLAGQMNQQNLPAQKEDIKPKLKALKELLDEGLITQEEFQKKKDNLLLNL
jgi:membrane protease subunit (stomatin/prohibitin family)